jgi:hypothetical protein
MITPASMAYGLRQLRHFIVDESFSRDMLAKQLDELISLFETSTTVDHVEACEKVAEALLRVAVTGEHNEVVFAPKGEECAQAILRWVRRVRDVEARCKEAADILRCAGLTRSDINARREFFGWEKL